MNKGTIIKNISNQYEVLFEDGRVSFKGDLHYMPDIMSVYRHTSISVNVQHNDGEWGYMLFHSKTMKTILEKILEISDNKYQDLIKQKIKFYEKEIERYEREQYYEKNIIARILRPKTYIRLIKRTLRKIIH